MAKQVEQKDGTSQVFEFSNPKGHPQNAMSDQDIVDKFHHQTEDVLAKDRRDKIVDWVSALEKHDRLDELFQLVLPD